MVTNRINIGKFIQPGKKKYIFSHKFSINIRYTFLCNATCVDYLLSHHFVGILNCDFILYFFFMLLYARGLLLFCYIV